MSTLITLLLLNDGAANGAAVRVSLPMYIKFSRAILHVILMLCLLQLVGLCLIILKKIFLVISKKLAFALKKDCLPLLMRKLSCGFLYRYKSISLSTL